MARARSLAEFQKSFPDEESCAAFLFKQRWPDGFVCPGCRKRRVVGLKSRPRLHECLDCGRQTSVTAGTTMHRSKLPLTTWFWAAHLMTTHSNGMSARQLEDQLGVTYKTAWLLTQKLRRSMVDPNRERLEGVVEVDQAEVPFREGDAFFEPGNAGKILVIGAVEVIDRASNQAKPRRKHAKYLDTRSGRLRLAMIADNSAASIAAFVRANVKPGTTLLTDGHASYPGLSGYRTIRALSAPWPGTSFYRGAIGLSRCSSDGLSAHIMAYVANTLTRISTNSCFATIAASIAMFHSKRCSGSPPTTNPPAIGTSSSETILAKPQAGPRAAPTTYRYDLSQRDKP